MFPMEQATTLAEVSRSCDPRPLNRDELADFFVNTANARDPVMSRRAELRKRLEQQRDKNAKLLFCGHGGCGKSTELVKLADEIQDDFFTVSFSVAQECNLFHVPVEHLLVVMMERLLAASHSEGLEEGLLANNETLRLIYEWFAETLEIKEVTLENGENAGAGVDTSQTLLSKTIGLSAQLKTLNQQVARRVRRMTFEKPHRLAELAERCNLLIKAVNQALNGSGKHLLIMIEDLDKVNLSDAQRIFLMQLAILAGLNCNIICTVPIFLLHSPNYGALEQHFATIELPMLKVTGFKGEVITEGRSSIRAIIAKRVADALIAPEALELLIEKTGGVLRDVFEVLVVAGGAAESLSTQGKQDAVITEDNVRYGLNRRKTEYARAITTIDLPKEKDWNLSTDALYAKLRELKSKPVRVLPSEPTTMVLLKARAVIEYNGEGFFAVHPLVVELLDSMAE